MGHLQNNNQYFSMQIQTRNETDETEMPIEDRLLPIPRQVSDVSEKLVFKNLLLITYTCT